MISSPKLPKDDRSLLVILAFVFLLTRLPAIFVLPLVQDESIYAMMIEEQAAHPTLVPTFMSYAVSWKPPVFFWAYDIITRPLLSILPLEVAYRLPSVLFGLGSLFTTFLLLRNSGVSGRAAFFAMLVFLISLYTLYPQTAVLTDAMAFFFISCSLYVYSESSLGRKRFIIAAALAFTAFWVKLVVAFMIPVLAVAYFLTVDRKVLSDKIFLLSLAAVPLAMVMHYALMDSYGLAAEAYSGNVISHLFTSDGISGQLDRLSVSLVMLITTGGIIWISLSLAGFLKHYRDNYFMSAWYVLSIFPLFTSDLISWYFLPVMPAIGYFAVLHLIMWKGKEKVDTFFVSFFMMLIIVSAAFIAFSYKDLFNVYPADRYVGLWLSGKDNVLIVGEYAPGIVAYKVLPEIRQGGVRDFGWIAMPRDPQPAVVSALIANYHSSEYPVVNGSFSSLFVSNSTFRKDSNITKFDYIVISGDYNITPPGSTLLYQNPDALVSVYKTG